MVSPEPRRSRGGVRKIFRPRALVYFAAWSLVGLLLVYGLLTRDRLQVNVLHDRNPPYVLLSDGANSAGLLEPMEAARKAAAHGVPCYAIALGTPSGVGM